MLGFHGNRGTCIIYLDQCHFLESKAVYKRGTRGRNIDSITNYAHKKKSKYDNSHVIMLPYIQEHHWWNLLK